MANVLRAANIIINEVRDIVEDDAVMPNRRIYTKNNAFDMSEHQFIKMFRLSKELTRHIIHLVEEHSAPPSRASALNAEVKVLTALRFFASGSYQMDIGCNINMALSQSSVSRCIREVVDILNINDIFNAWVKFPRTIREMENIRNRFYRVYGFPGVIGCIDCTHVAIVPPVKDDPVHPEHIFVNRKGYYSINVQLICNSDLKIIHCNTRFPGSTHDNFIWNNCNVLPLLRRLHENTHGFYLLEDSGYGLRSWIMTPLLNVVPRSAEDRYNNCHKQTRATIERCNGVLKMRFRCLLKHRVLHYAPDMAAKIIKACVVLHNMCIDNNIQLEEEEEEHGIFDCGLFVPEIIEENINRQRMDPELLTGRRVQRGIIRRHFSNI